MLREQLDDDLKSAMKSRDALRLSVLRMLKSAAKYAEIERREPLTDDDVLQVVARECKRRRESIEQFEKGNRADLVAKESAELEILKRYLPEQLDETEVIGIAREVISELHAASKADKGKVMGALMQKVRGKADGRLVNRIVDELLEGSSG
ncbi:MAG: GatB/YqeY domain-containing protein [Armatimonadetes bacterium]|nr:GatB/YqeY domain-containing protein [Armatimonadota bacterium]